MTVWTWIEEHSLLLTAISGLMFVGTLAAIPLAVVLLPADYFHPDFRRPDRHPLVQLALAVARNLLGAICLLAGVAMLVLPGQGLLTILVALALLDVPGKRRLELRLLRIGAVRRALERWRARWGRPPLRLPEPDPGPEDGGEA